MSNIAVLGSLWGDEGKGRVVHYFSKDYDWVIRFNGGANAGHTIYRDGKKYVHNLLPSVDFRVPQVKAYLGSGMVIDLEKLRDEVYDADDAFPGCAKRIYVDKNAFMVLNEHKVEDKAKNAHIGSTNRGIGPAYMDKIGRSGTRIADMFKRSSDPYYADFMYQLIGRGVRFVDLLDVRDEMSRGNLLYEGAQGVLLDINHGIYPYVSCSDCTVGGIYTSGFHFAPPKEVYGVVKCYTTKVGEGPFPSELKDKTGDELRERGHEYGATTGRPRRVGWLDLPALEYACKVSGITKLIMTKFDILSGMEKVPVCATYGKPPKSPRDFFDVTPQLIQLDGWKTADRIQKFVHELEADIEPGSEYDFEFQGFDEGLNNFIKYVEKSVGRQIDYISCGTDDKDIHKYH
jgi:adenylosuccinate synthase